MKQAGQIVLTPFPYTDLSGAKLRPASRYGDWLVCMVSSRLEHAEAGFDETLAPADDDFADSGLKAPSVAVLDGGLLAGSIGSIGNERLARVRRRLAKWIACDE